MDPVTLGLCSQMDLDFEVNRAAKDRPNAVIDRGQTVYGSAAGSITVVPPGSPTS